VATEITINPLALRSMLADLKLTAGDDDTLPMLNGINLHLDERNGNTILVGTSTNRFIFGQDHAVVTGAGDPVFLPMDYVDRVLGALEPHEAYVLNAMTATLTADDTTITLAITGLKESTTLTTERPKYGFIETKGITGDEGAVNGPIFIDPRWVKLLCKIAARRQTEIRLQPAGHDKPQHIQIGETFRVLAVGIKRPDAPLCPIYSWIPTPAATPAA
jgi:hypothetical protein